MRKFKDMLNDEGLYKTYHELVPKNLPKDESEEKTEIPMDTSDLKPKKFSEKTTSKNESIKLNGKVAHFNKDLNIKASTAFNFLEDIKVNKGSVWYMMIEKQDNGLQMVKYNYNEGIDMNAFVTNLKDYYISKYQNQTDLIKLIESIDVKGNEVFSTIENIPSVTIEGKKMITIITEDLIKLLN